MKLCSFEKGNATRLGALKGGKLIDLSSASNGELPEDMLSLLQGGPVVLSQVRNLVEQTNPDTSIDDVRLLAPLSNPSKVIAIGLNYQDHLDESGMAAPTLAIMFCKYPSAIVGPDDAIEWSPALTQKVDYEAELAVVIGKQARNVSKIDAYEYIAGYTICNDVSARDLQLENGDQWLRGKCLDTFCPLGPVIVTRDEIKDPHVLGIKTEVNGEVRQDSNTRHLIYDIPYLVEYLSAAFTLIPGDIIATGTPAGVGAFSDPPVWLRDGDVVSMSIEGIGSLTNHCVERS